MSAKGDASINPLSLDNHAGSIVAAGDLGASIAGVLGNQVGTLSGSATTVSAASADNTDGLIEGDELALTTTGNLVNHGGAIRQYSSADQTLAVGGTLDNTSGTIGSNASNLTLLHPPMTPVARSKVTSSPSR
jgi:filamentous hemagglutinin